MKDSVQLGSSYLVNLLIQDISFTIEHCSTCSSSSISDKNARLVGEATVEAGVKIAGSSRLTRSLHE